MLRSLLSSRARRAAVIALVLVGAVVGFLTLAPPGIGGGTTYALITGASMEPRLSEGDLVLLRERGRYARGDVVGYEDDQLGRLVLHRIVGGGERGFVLQGDANGHIDPTRPATTAIAGEEWLAIPRVGHLLEMARQPWTAGLLATAILPLAVGRGGRRRRRPGKGGEGEPPPSVGGTAAVLMAAGACLAIFGALALVAFASPTTETEERPSAFRHVGTFDYAATAAPGATYPDGRVAAPQAVFTRLVDRLELSFRYRIDAGIDAPADLAGRVRISARIGDGAGWNRSLPAAGTATLAGGEATARLELELPALRALVRDFERQTGARGESYTLTVLGHADLRGRLNGEALDADFRAPLALTLSADRLRPQESPAALPGGSENGLERAQAGSLSASVANRIELFGVGPSVVVARVVGSLGALAALAALAAVGRPALRRALRDEEYRLRLRYGGRLVETAAPLPPDAGRDAVTLRSLDELARMAERHDRPILRERVGTRARYTVEDSVRAYRYEGPAERSNGSAPDAPDLEGRP